MPFEMACDCLLKGLCAHVVDTGAQSICLLAHAVCSTAAGSPLPGADWGLLRARHWVGPFTWPFSLNCRTWEAWPGSACLERNEYIVSAWADHSFCLVPGCRFVSWVQGSALAISRDEGAQGV